MIIYIDACVMWCTMYHGMFLVCCTISCICICLETWKVLLVRAHEVPWWPIDGKELLLFLVWSLLFSVSCIMNPFAQTTKTQFQHEHLKFSLLLNPYHWLRVSFFWGWVDPPTRLTSKDGWWALPARDTLMVYWNCTHMCKCMYTYLYTACTLYIVYTW